MPRPKPERSGFKGRVKTREDDQHDDRERSKWLLRAGDMALQDVFHNDPRTPPAPPWHDEEAMPQGSDKQRSRHHDRP